MTTDRLKITVVLDVPVTDSKWANALQDTLAKLRTSGLTKPGDGTEVILGLPDSAFGKPLKDYQLQFLLEELGLAAENYTHPVVGLGMQDGRPSPFLVDDVSGFAGSQCEQWGGYGGPTLRARMIEVPKDRIDSDTIGN